MSRVTSSGSPAATTTTTSYRNGDEQLRRAALLAHRGSATSVEIWTSETGLQLYTGNRFDGTLRGAGGAPYWTLRRRRSGDATFPGFTE